MNLLEARTILELPKNYTQETLKKNYRRLILQYHPDKCKEPMASEKFAKINDAYKLLTNSQGQNVIDDLLKSFNFSSLFQNKGVKITKNIFITPLEYLTGTTKSIEVDSDKSVCCTKCLGTGYTNFNVCMDCIGNGVHFEKKNKVVSISKNMNLHTKIIFENFIFTVKLTDPKYFFKETLCYSFDITLKESLTGFTKSFNDPFGETHTITIYNTIIKSNDGYKLHLRDTFLLLVFNVIYPEYISDEAKNKIKEIDF